MEPLLQRQQQKLTPFSMKRMAIVLVLALASGFIYAQNAKLFINKREVALPFVYFLDPAAVDSVNFYTGDVANQELQLPTTGVDSVFVVFKRDMANMVSYHKLLELFHLDKRAQDLPLTLGYTKEPHVKDAEKMMFDINLVPSVIIQTTNDTHTDYVSIFRPYRRPHNSEAGKMITWLQGYSEGMGDSPYYEKYKRKQ